MGKNKSSRNKNRSATVATNANKEATYASVSDEGHERKRTVSDKNTTSTGPEASQADEQCEDLEFYKNKCNALKANLKATEKKCVEKESIIKDLEKENNNLKARILELQKVKEELQAKSKIEQNEKFYSVAGSETSLMDVDQVDICEQKNEKGTDIHHQTVWKQNQFSTAWDLQQPSTSSHDGQWNEGKQHTRRRSQVDVRERWSEHKQHSSDNRQSRQQRNRDEWAGNQNHKMWLKPSSGGLKVEPPAVYKIVTEVTGDLFEAPKDNSLAHCVAEDLRMGSGIAVTFRQMFKRVDELLDQKKKQGDIAVLQDTERYIYYLITKPVSTGKPTMDTLHRSLLAMREHAAAHNVSKIAMPRIGCGLDRLDWNKVKPLIENVFSGLNVTVTVYNYNEDDAPSRPPNYSNLTIKEAVHPVADIDVDTAILCFSAADGSFDPVLDSLDRKFNILFNYHNFKPKNLGSVLDIRKDSYLICILFVRDKKDDELSFKLLAQSLVQARKLIDKYRYEYVALEAFYDQHDELVMEKVITLLRNCLNTRPRKELWICWPESVPNVKRRLHFQTHTR